MEELIARCAGIDVGQAESVVCVRVPDAVTGAPAERAEWTAAAEEDRAPSRPPDATRHPPTPRARPVIWHGKSVCPEPAPRARVAYGSRRGPRGGCIGSDRRSLYRHRRPHAQPVHGAPPATSRLLRGRIDGPERYAARPCHCGTEAALVWD